MIVEIGLVLGAILFAVAIHYVMQKTPVNLNAMMQDISAVNRRIEVLQNNLTLAIHNTQEWVKELMQRRSLEGRTKRREVDLTKRVETLEGQGEDCQADLGLLEKRIEELKKRPQLEPLYEEMRNLQAEMKAGREKLHEIIQMEDVAATEEL
jgi:chromosome segregation ATPase